MVNIKNTFLPGKINSKKDIISLIPEISTRNFVKIIFNVLKDAKAEEIVFVDARDKSNFTEYLIVCQGNSQPHCRSIAEKVKICLKNKGYNPIGMEGENEGNWVLLDYGEFILHVFHPEIRKYYNLEGLFSNCFWLDFRNK
tara:strand:+ start:49 stop:471 length:423 start_codon:yes stop_codon:yes gene_type:complete